MKVVMVFPSGFSFLLSFVERLGGLDAIVAEGGKSFSLGQRQLLCLARAILSSAKVQIIILLCKKNFYDR